MDSVRIKKLHPDAVIPRYASPGAAGADICALIENEMIIPKGMSCLIGTGLAMELPQGMAALLFARSGLAAKTGLAPANKVGVIDSDYRGEIKVSLHNHSNCDALVRKGERIAQLVFIPYYSPHFVEVDELEISIRGEGGFGSTGS